MVKIPAWSDKRNKWYMIIRDDAIKFILNHFYG